MQAGEGKKTKKVCGNCLQWRASAPDSIEGKCWQIGSCKASSEICERFVDDGQSIDYVKKEAESKLMEEFINWKKSKEAVDRLPSQNGLKSLGEGVFRLRNYRDLLSKELDEKKKILSLWEERLIEEMENQGLKRFDLPQASFSISVQVFPSIEDEKRFFEYLDSTGDGGMIKRTVHHQTLRAWFKKGGWRHDNLPPGLKIFEKVAINMRRKNG